MLEIVLIGLTEYMSLRQMMFVDGENFTLRAQELAQHKRVELKKSDYYSRDEFIWFPRQNAITFINTQISSELYVRSHYYTSVVGDDQYLTSVREALWKIGFQPEVFKKNKREEKAKGVDIALARDVLSHAFRNNYDVAILIAGDGDYEPLVDEVKRLGKLVWLGFFLTSGLNPRLRLASDRFMDLTDHFIKSWNQS